MPTGPMGYVTGPSFTSAGAAARGDPDKIRREDPASASRISIARCAGLVPLLRVCLEPSRHGHSTVPRERAPWTKVPAYRTFGPAAAGLSGVQRPPRQCGVIVAPAGIPGGPLPDLRRGMPGPAAGAGPVDWRCGRPCIRRRLRGSGCQLRYGPDAAGAQPGKVEPDDMAEETRIGGVPLQLVIRECRMSRNALIPAGPVNAPVVLHAGTIPPACCRETSRVADPPRDASQSGQAPVTYGECPPGTSASALAPPDPS